jgi:hypothetical protein
MQHLATEAGEEWRADVLPRSVDGLLVAASLVIFVRRRAGRRAGRLPWVGLLLGVSASVAANIAAAQPTVLRVVAAWPPVAFALSFKLLVVLLRENNAQTVVDTGDLPGFEMDRTVDHHEVPDFWASAPYADTPEGRAAKLIEDGVGRRRLARELDISEHAARQLLAQRGSL